MHAKRKIQEKEAFQLARFAEREGDYEQSKKGYQKILSKNPLHIDATQRLLIIFRKSKAVRSEINLLHKSIKAHRLHDERMQRQWIDEHQELAEKSKPLAKMLGLLNAKDLPFQEHEVLRKWENRLIRLEKSHSSPGVRT